MLQETELLNHIHQNADIAKDSIQNLLEITSDFDFAKSLVSQLNEHQHFYELSDHMLKERHIEPKEARTSSKFMARMSADMKTITDNSSSKLAEMMIEGSTMGITNLTKQINAYTGKDKTVLNLAKKQLKTEQSNIDEMKKFL